MGRQRGSVWRLIENVYAKRLVEVEQMLRARQVPENLAQTLQVDPAFSVIEVEGARPGPAEVLGDVGQARRPLVGGKTLDEVEGVGGVFDIHSNRIRAIRQLSAIKPLRSRIRAPKRVSPRR